MRLVSIAMIGLLLIVTSFAIMDFKISGLEQAQEAKFYYKKAMRIACEDAGESLRQGTQVYGQSHTAVRNYDAQQVVDDFFKSLYLNLNAQTDGDKAKIAIYIPCIVMRDEDGYTLNVLESVLLKSETGVGGEPAFMRINLPKRPYMIVYKGEYYDYRLTGELSCYSEQGNETGILETMLKNKNKYSRFSLICDFNSSEAVEQLFLDAMVSDIEYYIKRHAKIANDSGFAFHLNLQRTGDAWQSSCQGVGVLAALQGMPVMGGDVIDIYEYSRVEVQRKEFIAGYRIKGTLIYGKNNCVHHHFDTIEQVFIDEQQAATCGYSPCVECYIYNNH